MTMDADALAGALIHRKGGAMSSGEARYASHGTFGPQGGIHYTRT